MSKKIWRPMHFKEITQVTIKVLPDFENTFLAGRKKTGLTLNFQELKFLLESVECKEKFANQEIFKEYFKEVFKNSLEKIQKEKLEIEYEVFDQYNNLFNTHLIKDFGYEYYDCIDEGSGKLITLVIKLNS